MQKLFGVIEYNYLIYQDILKSAFISFLTAKGASGKTQKNYWSDVNDFISWFFTVTKPIIDNNNHRPGSLLQSLSTNHVHNYIQHLQKQSISVATINRRLSSLRIFFNCAIEMTWMNYHPMEQIANIKMARPGNQSKHAHLLLRFEDHLHKQHVGKVTVKNYMSDVRGFLHWLETKGLLSGPQAHGS